MKIFPELEKEEEIIAKKRKENNKLSKQVGRFFLMTLILMITIVLLDNFVKDIPKVSKIIFGVGLFVSFILMVISIFRFAKSGITLKQEFLYQINYLRNILFKKEPRKYLDELKVVISILETRYSFYKKQDIEFDTEKKIRDFLKKAINHLKYYSNKNHLSHDDFLELYTFFDIILEKILNEDFELKGSWLKKPAKKEGFSRFINKTKNFVKTKWFKITFSLLASLIAILFFKWIGIIEKVSLETYFLCATLIFMIYSIFFK